MSFDFNGACGRLTGLGGRAALGALMCGTLLCDAMAITPARAEPAPSWLRATGVPTNQAAGDASAPRAPKPVEAKAEAESVDTEHIFGFSMGSDIGKAGEVELEIENVGRFARRAGAYTGLGTLSQVKFTLTDSFRISPGVSFSRVQINGVPDMVDTRRTALAGASLEFRYRLFDREVMPFGLTLHAAPAWNRLDELTGADAQVYGSEFAALIDKELVPGRLFAAFNLWYSGGTSRDRSNLWSHDSEFAMQGALSYKATGDLILGLETRYARAYHGLGLDHFAGDAVYVGPTFSMHLADNLGLSGTFSTQVAGKALGDARRLDLDHFERHQAMLRINYLF